MNTHVNAAAQSNLALSEILIACPSSEHSNLTRSPSGTFNASRGFRIEHLTLGRRITFNAAARFL